MPLTKIWPLFGSLGIFLGVLLVVSSPSSAADLAERITTRLATIDQASYERFRQCYGFQQGVYDLLLRIRSTLSETDATALDQSIKDRDPAGDFGVIQTFLDSEKPAVDTKKGDEAYGRGILEFNAQKLLPPQEQYNYAAQYGALPDDCVALFNRLDDIRRRVTNARRMIGTDPSFSPPTDDPFYP